MRFLMRLASGLLGLSMVLTMPALADDISNWSETDGSNNRAAPLGWQSGVMLPSQVEPTARAMMGAIKRFYDSARQHAATNTALGAMTTTANPNGVWRDGFTAAGDAPPIFYTASGSACSAADNGLQVTSGDGKCWIASVPADGMPLMEWGCKGDGSTADDTCISAAIASGVRHVQLGDHMYAYNTGHTVNNTMTFSGMGANQGLSGFKALTNNLTAFTVTAQFVTFEKLRIDGSNAVGTNSSGAAILINANDPVMHDLYIQSPCIGIDITNSNQAIVDGVVINGQSGSNCGGVRVGHSTTGANTVDTRIVNTTIVSSGGTPAQFGIRVEDSGGLFMSNNDVLASSVGTYILPSTNQQVIWTFGSNTVLGDTTNTQALLIDTAAASGVVKSFDCVSCWASSSATSDNADIANSSSGTVVGIHFSEFRSYAAAHHGIGINAGSEIDIIDSHVCGNSVATSNTYNGINILTGVNRITIRDGEVGGGCVGNATTQSVGINFGGTSSNVLVDGVDVSQGNTTAINYGGSVTGQITSNKGFNPRGAGNISLTGSPFNYTTGVTPEYLCISGGTVTSVITGGIVMLGGPGCIQLGPGQLVQFNYTGSPTLNTYRQ